MAYNILEKAQHTNNPRVTFINNPNTIYKRSDDTNRIINTASSLESRQYSGKKELHDQLKFIVNEYSPS